MKIVAKLKPSLKNDMQNLFLTLNCITSQIGQTHFKNLAAQAAKFIWPFWDIMRLRVKISFSRLFPTLLECVL